MHPLLRRSAMGLATLGAHGEVHHPGRRPALGRDRPGGQQERRAPDPRRVPAHRGGARDPQRAADPRRRVHARPARAPRRQGRLDGRERGPPAGRQHLRHRGRRGARRPDPRLVPRRGPAAGAIRGGQDAAAGRGHDRPAAPRCAPRRLQGHGRQDRRRGLARALRAARGPEAQADLHGRAFGDGDGERPARRGAHRGPDDDRQRRLRAPRPGPGSTALQDGRAGRRDRLQRDDGPRPREARRRRARRLPRPHRDRELHGARRSHQRRAAHPERRRPRTSRGSGATSAASACRRCSRARTCWSRRSRSSPSGTTRATRSRRSTTVPGRRSLPTSPRSPWRSPLRRTGRS